MENLSVPAILGCVFIRRHVKAIHPMDDNIELEEGESIPLVKSWAGASPAMQTPNEGNATSRPKPPAPKRSSRKTHGEIRVSKTRLVEPGQRLTVWVTSQASGPQYFLPN